MTSVTSTELAKGLSDILNRIYYQGESFNVERNGQAIATLTPAQPTESPRTTWRAVVAALGNFAWPDPTLADDLEAIQAAQPPLEEAAWHS